MGYEAVSKLGSTIKAKGNPNADPNLLLKGSSPNAAASDQQPVTTAPAAGGGTASTSAIVDLSKPGVERRDTLLGN